MATPPSEPPTAASRPTIDKDPAHVAHTKAMNVFSGDGSFIERFRKLKEAEAEAAKAGKAALQRKREWEDALKNRKKRRKEPASAGAADGSDGNGSGNAGSSEYLQQIRDAEARERKDMGSGIRPLFK